MHRTFPKSTGSLMMLAAFHVAGSAPTAAPAPPTTYYVSADSGRDTHDGRSPERAWQSLERVNAARLAPGDTVRFQRGSVWRGSLVPVSGADNAPITYTAYGEGPKPLILGSRPRSRPEDWVRIDGDIWATQPTSITSADALVIDVGNIIFDHGRVCGWKKWKRADLQKPYDYYYDRPSQRVFLRAPANPAALHRSIELALARHVVNQSGRHHVVYDGLAIMYGASHGFGGGSTHHLVIRRCDLGYIGGAHQHTKPDGTPVRFGNAIEFWGAAHDHLVEGCRIWEVYDAALTNQGRDPSSHQIDITYRHNLILNSEYSFEYWNHPASAVTRNIRFVHNTCLDAGVVWSHAQRPNRNGSHLMFYSNTAATSGVEIKYNVFCGHTEWGSRYSSGWATKPDLDRNLWYSDQGVMANWFGTQIRSFEDYQTKTGLEPRSVFARPRFVDAARGDYRLAPDSPGARLGPGQTPAGVSRPPGNPSLGK